MKLVDKYVVVDKETHQANIRVTIDLPHEVLLLLAGVSEEYSKDVFQAIGSELYKLVSQK